MTATTRWNSRPSDPLVRTLATSYRLFKARYAGLTYVAPLSTKKPAYQHFVRCADRIRELQERAYPVHPQAFLRVVFELFRGNVYPAHLNSRVVWDLYFRAENTRPGSWYPEVSEQDVCDELRFLAETRGQTIQQLYQDLPGLFSPFARQTLL